jgi:signal-transduction protein with cAMP-binding, CBS, and nucleotidyltransferase domain
MRVSQFMHTPAATCGTNATLRDVAHIMDVKNVGCVVVIDSVGEVAGIATDRDIAVRGVGHGRSADVAVTEVMSRDVATISPSADEHQAAAIMTKRGVRRLPVVDEHAVVHGVVALDDLVRRLGRDAEELNELLVTQAANFGGR